MLPSIFGSAKNQTFTIDLHAGARIRAQRKKINREAYQEWTQALALIGREARIEAARQRRIANFPHQPAAEIQIPTTLDLRTTTTRMYA